MTRISTNAIQALSALAVQTSLLHYRPRNYNIVFLRRFGWYFDWSLYKRFAWWFDCVFYWRFYKFCGVWGRDGGLSVEHCWAFAVSWTGQTFLALDVGTVVAAFLQLRIYLGWSGHYCLF